MMKKFIRAEWDIGASNSGKYIGHHLPNRLVAAGNSVLDLFQSFEDRITELQQENLLLRSDVNYLREKLLAETESHEKKEEEQPKTKEHGIPNSEIILEWADRCAPAKETIIFDKTRGLWENKEHESPSKKFEILFINEDRAFIKLNVEYQPEYHSVILKNYELFLLAFPPLDLWINPEEFTQALKEFRNEE